MSIDYDGVGGIGISIDKDIEKKIKEYIENTGEEFYGLSDVCSPEFKRAGSGCYGGGDRYYAVVDGRTFIDIKNNIPKFIKEMSDFGIIVKEEELIVIEDIHIW